MPKVSIDKLKTDATTGYPEPFRQLVLARVRKRLGDAAGLSQLGINLTTLKPTPASSQRHWHAAEDEFVYMLAGEVVLCEDDGAVVMRPRDAAGFKAGVANGHCLINRSDRDGVYLEVGTRAARERAEYPDIDRRMERDETGVRYFRKVGPRDDSFVGVSASAERTGSARPER
jgi:uncharacterized cupin superfamily protein